MAIQFIKGFPEQMALFMSSSSKEDDISSPSHLRAEARSFPGRCYKTLAPRTGVPSNPFDGDLT